jgi:hypothetical protein
MKMDLIVGLFAENKRAIEKFGTNIYMNYLYGQTIEELLEAERELDIAKKLESTEAEILMIEERIKFLESVVSLATANYESSQQDDDTPDMNQ